MFCKKEDSPLLKTFKEKLENHKTELDYDTKRRDQYQHEIEVHLICIKMLEQKIKELS